MEQYPPNSDRWKERNQRRVEQVVSGEVRTRKRPLNKKFTDLFFSGDARGALEYSVANTVIPAVKELVINAVNDGLERRLYGTTGRPGRRSAPGGPLGPAAYHNMYKPQGQPKERELPGPSRMRHAFDDIVIESRQEAEEVIDRLYDCIEQWEVATVADFYGLIGYRPSHTDKKWGWEDLRGAGVQRVRGGGYILRLPEPRPL